MATPNGSWVHPGARNEDRRDAFDGARDRRSGGNLLDRRRRDEDRRRSPPLSQLGTKFAHSLIPIGIAYLTAHYFSYFFFGEHGEFNVLDQRSAGHAGRSSDLRANNEPTLIWYVQVGALVAGHVTGLVLAHDKAVAVYGDIKRASLSSDGCSEPRLRSRVSASTWCPEQTGHRELFFFLGAPDSRGTLPVEMLAPSARRPRPPVRRVARRV